MVVSTWWFNWGGSSFVLRLRACAAALDKRFFHLFHATMAVHACTAAFNPFAGFMSPTYILKSQKVPELDVLRHELEVSCLARQLYCACMP